MTGGGKPCMALLCLVLAACSQTGGWSKPGADAAETARAYQDCTTLAAPVVNRAVGIDQDILATRSADAQHSSVTRTDERLMQDSTTRWGDKIIAACMRQKGFSQSR